MNVEDSFLVRDDLDNALFLDFLKEAEGFGSAPLEELAPVLLADDGFSALAYDVDLLNLVRGFRVVGVYQDLEERFQFSRSFVVLTVFWESGCSLRAGGFLEVVSLRRIFIYLLFGVIPMCTHCRMRLRR